MKPEPPDCARWVGHGARYLGPHKVVLQKRAEVTTAHRWKLRDGRLIKLLVEPIGLRSPSAMDSCSALGPLIVPAGQQAAGHPYGNQEDDHGKVAP